MDREAAIRLAEIERAGQMERTEREWQGRELVASKKYSSRMIGSDPGIPRDVELARIEWDARTEIARLSVPGPMQDTSVEVAQIQADAARDVARIQFPESPPAKPALREVALPDDLEAHVLQWNDDWARDDVRGSLRKLYLEFQDGNEASTWAKVRRHARIAELGDA